MTYRALPLPRLAHNLFSMMNISSAVLMVIMLCSVGNAAVIDKQQPAPSCTFSDASYDPATDVLALEAYRNALAQLLKQEQFSELDCISNAARSGKTRFSGGAWKLRQFYIGLDTPRPGHATEEDWRQHFELVERWRKQNPNSIAAPIVLAESYITYGWDARGDGYADKVSDSGWKLFAERLEKAKSILDQVAPAKCPDWYIAMLNVARGESWDLPQHFAILKEAIAYEPGYQYYYRMVADYLQPKWSGEEGDPARFAEEKANRVGGDAGDILYFLISEGILCGCNESEFAHFSWPRLQKGYAALEKQYGVSLISVNAIALMASKAADWEAADPAFKRIGNEWDQELWVTEAWFKQNRDTAAQAAPMMARAHSIRKEAEANMQTPEGQAYRKKLEKKLSGYEQSCLKESNGDAHKFDFFVQVGADGSAQNAQTETRPDHFAYCLMRTLYDSYTKKKTPLPAPPHEAYWVLLELDPTTLSASSK